MCRLRRACAIIELYKLPCHALNVPGIQEDEVIESVFAQRTMKSLDVCIRIRGVVRRGHSLDVQYPELLERPSAGGKLIALPVLGGVQHDYRLAA